MRRDTKTSMSGYVLISLIVLSSSACHCQARTVHLEGIGILIKPVNDVYRYKSDHLDTASWDNGLIFPRSSVPSQVVGLEYACVDWRPYADDPRTNDVINRIMADAAGDLLIAMPSAAATGNGWTRLTAGSTPDFYLDNATRSGVFTPDTNAPYWFYRQGYPTPRTWVLLPTNSVATHHSPFVFAQPNGLWWDNPPDLMGNAVTIAQKWPGEQSTTLANPNLFVLSNGDYLAMISGAVCTNGGASLWRSVDKGLNWTEVASGFQVNRYSIFELQGSIYVIGMNTSGSGETRIYKSSNSGATWTSSVFAGYGGQDAPSHMAVINGRIWKGAYSGVGPGFYSAPTNANLMLESSWTLSVATYGTVTLANGQAFSPGNELDMIASKEGVLYNLGRDSVYRPEDGWQDGITTIQPDINDLTKTTWDPNYAGPRLPGNGNGKCTAQYDPVSDQYWALTSGQDRGRLNLYSASSAGGRIGDFQFRGTILAGNSTFQGFNYPFIQFDGDDIVFVSRTAWDTHRGRASRWHNGNIFTFHRVKNFRTLGTPNYIANPGFEDGNMAGWLTLSGGAEDADFTQVNNPHTGSYNLAHYKSSAYKVNSYQSMIYIPNGTYSASAWVKCSGGQNQCYFYANGFGGAEIRTNILANSTYTKVTITGINVVNGTCNLGVYSDANAGNWMTMDDVEFFTPASVIASAVWTNRNSGSWPTAGNWSNNIPAGGASSTADFSRLTLPGNLTVTLDAARTVGNLIFGDVGNTYDWTLNTGSVGPLTLSGTNTPMITVNNRTTTIAAVLAGTGGLVKAGAGTLTLTAVNGYLGPTVVNAGTLVLNHGNSNPSTLNSSSGLTINSNGVAQVGLDNSLAGSTSPIGTLPVTINAGGTLTGSALSSQQGTPGAGTSTHIRGLLTLNGGTLRNSGTSINNDYGSWDLDAGVTVNSGPNYGVTSTIDCKTVIPSQAGGTIFNVAAGGTPSGIDLLVSGTLIDGSKYHDTGIIKTGDGTLVLAGVNTYAHPTIVSDGTLLVNGSTAGGGAVTVQTTATLGGIGSVGGPVTFNAGSFAQFTLGSPLSLWNSLTVAMAGTSPVVRLNLTNNVPPGTYTLATYNTAGSSGMFASSPVIASGSLVAGTAGAISTGGGLVSLVVTFPPSAPGFPANALQMSGGTVTLTATGTIGSKYTLWTTTNVALTPVTSAWTLLGSGTITSNPFTITDPGALTNQQRFYLFRAP